MENKKIQEREAVIILPVKLIDNGNKYFIERIIPKEQLKVYMAVNGVFCDVQQDLTTRKITIEFSDKQSCDKLNKIIKGEK